MGLQFHSRSCQPKSLRSARLFIIITTGVFMSTGWIHLFSRSKFSAEQKRSPRYLGDSDLPRTESLRFDNESLFQSLLPHAAPSLHRQRNPTLVLSVGQWICRQLPMQEGQIRVSYPRQTVLEEPQDRCIDISTTKRCEEDT